MCIQDRDEAINVVKESFDQWRTELNEIWNVAGILSSGNYTNYPGVSYTSDDTLPYITSHYGYYMSSWHIILGIPVYTCKYRGLIVICMLPNVQNNQPLCSVEIADLFAALSGQNVDVNEQKMTFSPKFSPCCSNDCKSYTLPVMLPTVWGTLKRNPGFDLVKEELSYVHYTLSLEYGSVDVMQLSVDDCKMQNPEVTTVDVANPAKWYCRVTCM